MKQQINFRASDLTARQLDALMQSWGTSQTETLTVVIDRIYQQEIAAMTTATAQRTVVLLESGYDTGLSFEQYSELAAQLGDDPRDYSSSIADFEFVSLDYAKSDPDWQEDVTGDWPDTLPVWRYKAE
jgi:hypothetical protein